MPAAMVKTPKDEELWEQAKQSAADAGHKDDWPYITAIFKQMHGLKKSGMVGPDTDGPVLVLLVSDMKKAYSAYAPGGARNYTGKRRVGQNYGTAPPPLPKMPELSYQDKIRQHWKQEPRGIKYGEPAGPVPASFMPPPKQAAAPKPMTEKEQLAHHWAGRATEAFAAKHGMTQQQVVDKYTQRARERMTPRTAGNPGPEYGENQIGEKLKSAANTFQAENPQFKRYEHERWTHGGKAFADVSFHRVDHGNGHVTIAAFAGKEGAGRQHIGTYTTLNPAQRQLGHGAWFDHIANKMSVMNATGNKEPKQVDRSAQREEYLKKLDSAGISRTKSQQHLDDTMSKSIRLHLIVAV